MNAKDNLQQLWSGDFRSMGLAASPATQAMLRFSRQVNVDEMYLTQKDVI